MGSYLRLVGVVVVADVAAPAVRWWLRLRLRLGSQLRLHVCLWGDLVEGGVGDWAKLERRDQADGKRS